MAKRRSLTATSVAAGFLAVGLIHCGDTTGGVKDGDILLNERCNPDATCLAFSISPSRIPADGVSTAGFRATLRDPNGVPIPEVEICFIVEDPGAATIIEPVGDNCAFTNGNGQVSGRVRAGTTPTSVQLVAFDRGGGFGLETFDTLILGSQAPTGVAISAFSSTGTVGDGDPPNPGRTASVCATVVGSIAIAEDDTTGEGTPIAEARVRFSISSGFGSVSPSSATTGADGTACTVYDPGTTPGPFTTVITATSGAARDSVSIGVCDNEADPTCT